MNIIGSMNPCTTEAKQLAFNRGADARLAGRPISACPNNSVIAVYWRMGWNHVNSHWGDDAIKDGKPRWKVEPLPPVKSEPKLAVL